MRAWDITVGVRVRLYIHVHVAVVTRVRSCVLCMAIAESWQFDFDYRTFYPRLATWSDLFDVYSKIIAGQRAENSPASGADNEHVDR